MTAFELAERWAKPARVLLVEDDLRQTAAVAQALTHYGCFVDTAGTVQQALVALRGGSFDLALVDLTLPDGNGAEVLNVVRECFPNTPAMVMTSSCDLELIAQALCCGAVTVLLKPFPFSELKRTLGLFKLKVLDPDPQVTATV